MVQSLMPTTGKRNDDFQTPTDLAKKIVAHFQPYGKILEPCSGDGNFLDALPEGTEWCEAKLGRDFFDYEGRVDWVITNPPYSKMRAFMNKSMEVSDNVVFLTMINHLWFKARLRDVFEKGFGIREILIFDTPKNFPQSGFQVGCFHLKRGYEGDIRFSKFEGVKR